MYSWGLNLKGQLGVGDYDNRTTPNIVASLLPRGSGLTPSSKDILIKRQKSSNDLLNKNDPITDVSFKKNGEPFNLLQQDERVVEIACGTLHTLVKTSKIILKKKGVYCIVCKILTEFFPLFIPVQNVKEAEKINIQF